MAKLSATKILEFAKRGASHRYQELKAELAALTRDFPRLRYGSADVDSKLPTASQLASNLKLRERPPALAKIGSPGVSASSARLKNRD